MSDQVNARTGNASETAQVVTELVVDRHAVPDEAAKDLQRLVGHSLEAPSAGERRFDRLALLIELVADSGGQYVTIPQYESERAEKARSGEEHSSVAELLRAYGHWLACLRAACRFWFRGGSERVCASHSHARRHSTYEPSEIVAGLIEARRHIYPEAFQDPDISARECWPTEWEYVEYATLRRRLSRLAGKDVRLGSSKQIRKAYGSYDDAVKAAAALVRRAR